MPRNNNQPASNLLPPPSFQAPRSGPRARQQFTEFWARSRKAYDRDKDIEEILWQHLTATGNDSPEKFEAGIKHFGLKKQGDDSSDSPIKEPEAAPAQEAPAPTSKGRSK